MRLTIVFIIICIIVWWIFFKEPSNEYIQNVHKNVNKSSYYSKVNSLRKGINSKNVNKSVYSAIQLARVYQNGVPDKYNKYGIKVKGIKPDISKAIEYYTHASKKGSCLATLELANIYHYEIENKELAKGLYQKIIDMPSNEIGNLEYISEARNQMFIINTDETQFDLHNVSTVFAPIAPQPLIPTLNLTLNTTPNTINRDTMQPDRNNVFGFRTENNIGEEVRNDPHNSHDHVVVQTVKKSVNNLKNATPMLIDMPTSLQQIRMTINNMNNVSQDKRNDAIKTLDKIESNYQNISYLGMTESEVLNLVWNRVHMSDFENKKTAVENIIDELAESVEHGKVMCATGRTNRIVDSLNKVDPLVEIKPKWAINREMMEKASKLRSTMETNLSQTEKDALIELNPSKEQEQICNNFNENLKDELKFEFKKDYVDTGVMKQEILDNELNKWINDI